jgi:hypothetical protein
MSEPQGSTLPLRLANTAVLGASNATTNINQGAGNQSNYTQAGGHGNIQYNAENQTIHHHGSPRSQGEPQMMTIWKLSKRWPLWCLVKQPWHLPRQAAGCYAGYEDISARLKSCILETQPEEEQMVFVLSGMGGVGKSESVLQFLKKYNKDLRKR